MQYFVTGATGFIGKRLVKALLARRGSTVHFLMRPGSEDKLAQLYSSGGFRAAGPFRLRGTSRHESWGWPATNSRP